MQPNANNILKSGYIRSNKKTGKKLFSGDEEKDIIYGSVVFNDLIDKFKPWSGTTFILSPMLIFNQKLGFNEKWLSYVTDKTIFNKNNRKFIKKIKEYMIKNNERIPHMNHEIIFTQDINISKFVMGIIVSNKKAYDAIINEADKNKIKYLYQMSF